MCIRDSISAARIQLGMLHVADPDLGWALTRAGENAAAEGKNERALVALRMAHEQWVVLKHAERVSHTEQLIVRIGG